MILSDFFMVVGLCAFLLFVVHLYMPVFDYYELEDKVTAMDSSKISFTETNNFFIIEYIK